MSLHHFTTRVYLEDVDAGGIVYHANHLKYAERARTEMIAASGLRHAQVMEQGAAIVVKALKIDYLAPLRLEQEVVVKSRVLSMGNASCVLAQEICRGADVCARLEVVLVHTVGGKPVRWSDALRQALA